LVDLSALPRKDRIARQAVLNAGLLPDDPRFEEAWDMARGGKQAWEIAAWAGRPRYIVLALGGPAEGVET
jgi:hypothetical protein